MLRTKKWIVGCLLAIPLIILAGDLALAGKPPKVTLPEWRYQISFIPFPNNGEIQGECGQTWNMDRFGQVVVGSFFFPSPLDIQHAFLYDPIHNPNEAIDLNDWFLDENGVPLPGRTINYPTGYHLNTGRDVNDHQVVVGLLKDQETGSRCGFAIDLTIWPPVLDLLPTAGSSDSRPVEINENGDILIAYESGVFLFNPGYYGDPAERFPRDGTPLDFSGDNNVLLLPLSGNYQYYQLNNPIFHPVTGVMERPAQIAGKTVDGFAFRYRIDDPTPEPFDFQLATMVRALNDDGVFCGRALLPLGSTRPRKDEIFRYDDSIQDPPPPQLLPGHAKFDGEFVWDMNSSQDLVTYVQVYRDDWGASVDLDDLVVDGLFRRYATPLISDRIEVGGDNGDTAGIIVAKEGNSDEPARLIVLTPVPVN